MESGLENDASVTHLGGSHGACALFLEEIAGVRVLLDAPLDLAASLLPRAPNSSSPVRLAGPELASIAPSVDVVLISCPEGTLALPYLTAVHGFHAPILATDPVKHICRHLALEVLTWGSSTTSAALPVGSETSSENVNTSWPLAWTKPEMEAALARIQPVSYHASVVIADRLVVKPVSSAGSLGAAAWIMSPVGGGYKTAFLGPASAAASRHPAALDTAALMGLDSLIIPSHALRATQPSDPAPDEALAQILHLTLSTVSSGGSALLPLPSSGLVLDLVESIAGALATANLAGKVPMFLISPSAAASLAYTTICGEWLCTERQNRLYIPQSPFNLEELVAARELFIFASLEEAAGSAVWKSPSVVFTGSTSLRGGPAATLATAWAGNESHAIILTDPGFPVHETLGPFPSSGLQTHYVPLDVRLDAGQLVNLIETLGVKTVIAASSTTAVAAAEAMPSISWTLYQPNQRVGFPVNLTCQRGSLSSDLAGSVKAMESPSKMWFAPVVGRLHKRDNEYQLAPASVSDVLATGKTKAQVLCGSVDVDKLIAQLHAAGVDDASLSPKAEGQTEPAVHIQSVALNASLFIALNGRSTRIVAATAPVRKLIKRVLEKHLIAL